ncbi:MAG: rhodanese-like domain-containing protein [Caldilineaceae bacterium]
MSIFSQWFGTGSVDPHKLSAADYNSRYVQTNTAHLLIDVRSPTEFAHGHVTAAINLPVQELQQRLAEIPRNKPVILYCRSGSRSGMGVTNAAKCRVYGCL